MVSSPSAGGERCVVWTDGACRGNPGPGGWGWIDDSGATDSGGDVHTTNQRMEVTAAHRAVVAHPGSVEIRSDSRYVVSAFNDGWIDGWIRRGWRNSKREPVANRDLWEPFVSDVRDHGDVTFSWVKGHAGDAMNERADELATAAADAIGRTEATGAHPAASTSTEPSRPDSTPRRLGRNELPDGFLYAVVGVRRLDDDRLAAARSEIERILPAQAEFHEDLVVVSGLRPGPEVTSAEVASVAGIPVLAVLPWPEPQLRLSVAERNAVDRALADATFVVTLERREPADARRRREALARRDAWLAATADAAMIVRDGDGPESRALARRFSGLGDEVWDLDLGAR